MLPVHNVRIKRYPDGSAELLVGSMPFGGGNIDHRTVDEAAPLWSPCEFPEDRAELAYARLERDAIADGDNGPSLADNAALCRASAVRRSVRRARKAVQDLARSNEWAYFVTLTLDAAKVDRYDPVEVLRHLRHWLGNNVRRKGLRYVLVPEHHKDGALHFHGLFNDALEAVDSGTVSVPGRKAPVKVRSEAHRAELEAQGGHPVYNLPGWGWGFSTAIQLYGEKDAAIAYVCKYIGKEMVSPSGGQFGTPSKVGGRWYYSGGDLQRPSVEWFDVDVRDWEDCPGWYSPESFPAGRFLTLRITAEGEILAPYSRTAVTSGGGDAKRDRGGDQPPKEGVTIAPGHSVGRADEAPMEKRTRASSAGSGPLHHATLNTVRPAHSPAIFSHLTNSGLSSRPGPPTPQPPGGESG